MHPHTWTGLLAGTLLLATSGLAYSAAGSGDDDAVGGGSQSDRQIEVLKKKAENERDFVLDKDERVSVNKTVLTKIWSRTPLDGKAFDYTPEQVREHWPELMRGFDLPYPSPEFLRHLANKYPDLVAKYMPDFDGDYDRFSRDLIDVVRLFFRGDFQQAMEKGNRLGPLGMIPGKVSQAIYAIYLEPSLSEKHMLLQDVADTVIVHADLLDRIKKDREFRSEYVLMRLAYSYALGRIAEDVPIPVAVGRNYPFKLIHATNAALAIEPDNPLALALRAAVDANIVRKIGKATGRITFGAKQSEVDGYFERALKVAPDLALIHYEYANAMLYLNKKRAIPQAVAELQAAMKARPHMAMEALDSMYAAKRLKEIQALDRYSGSFRSFERKRLAQQKSLNENLYCVSRPAFVVQ